MTWKVKYWWWVLLFVIVAAIAAWIFFRRPSLTQQLQSIQDSIDLSLTGGDTKSVWSVIHPAAISNGKINGL
jgi:hypothetical protein